MLLAWQRGNLEVATLSDSDCDEGESGDEEGPIVKYVTEEQYQSYVPHPMSPLAHHQGLWTQTYEEAGKPLLITRR
jgi:hypothetical protein